jgi:multidrug transporter EmrE-like cation transporter
LLLQPWTWLGVCAAVLLLGSFLVAIRELGIGISYATVTSLALVLITLLAAMIFKEPLNLMVVVGIALIVSGIVVLMVAQAAR